MRKTWKKGAALVLAGVMALGMASMAADEPAGSSGARKETSKTAKKTITCEEASFTESVPRAEKTRIIITQDGEVDDMNSLIHTLLYANDLDIAGIVQSSSSLHFSGHDDVQPQRWMGTDWMNDFLDAYEAVYPKLKVHDPDYMTPEEVRAITKVGNIKDNGEMEEVTEGSELIKACILDEDERTLYIGIGGGANTVGRALKSIEEEYKETDKWKEIYEKVTKKVVLTPWGNQDNVYQSYISVVWPDIRTMDVSGVSGPVGYSYGTQDIPFLAKKKMEGSFMYEHLVNGHGPLMDLYVTWGDGTYLEGEEWGSQFGVNEEMVGTTNWWGGSFFGAAYNRYDFLSEGDSPDWMIAIPTGLRSLEDPSYGGWGGRYALDSETTPHYSQPRGEVTMSHWMEAIMSEFAARADWCIEDSFENANHAPEVAVVEGLDFEAAAGEEITLTAKAFDPDGNDVSIYWWEYEEADTYTKAEGSDGVRLGAVEGNPAGVIVRIPADAKSGDTIHIILEANDNARHALYAYQRVIITIK